MNSKEELRAEELLKSIIEISKENNKVGYEMTAYELLTLQSALLLLKVLVKE